MLIGWDGADWKVINKLVDTGKMPTMEKFINNGVMGNLATLDPPLSPMLWTSIATGKTADQHGVMGFTQPSADGKRIQPVLSTSRKVKAVWNILMQEGYKTNVVGWWPSHPAEPVNGVYISNFFHKAKTPVGVVPQLAANAVHPPELAETLAEYRVFPWELTHEHIVPFVPEALKVDQEKDQRLNSVAKIISDAATVHASATWVMENTEWDFMAVYYDAIDHFGHGFMSFHPPKMPHTPKELFDIYHNVVEAGYRFHDMMLERLLQLAGDDCTVIIVSDHGFHSDHLRPKGIPEEPAGPAVQHRPFGIFAAAGPGIQKDELIFGASLLDITPTVLHLFGLPVGRDMKGKPLLQIYEKIEKADFIESWETVQGECGMHPGEKIIDPWAEQESMQQLMDLGYIEPLDADVQKNIDKTVNESLFYLARVHLNSGENEAALPILEKLCTPEITENRFGQRLIQCYLALQRVEDAEKIMELVLAQAEKITPGMNLQRGIIALSKEDNDAALSYFQMVEKAAPSTPGLYIQMGTIFMRKNQYKSAVHFLEKALEIDGDNAAAYHQLGVIAFRQKQFENAADYLLTSVGLQYFNPGAHFFLGETLLGIRNFKRAEEAFRVVIHQAPGMKRAHERLITLYEGILYNPPKAKLHKRFVQEKIKTISGENGKLSVAATRGKVDIGTKNRVKISKTAILEHPESEGMNTDAPVITIVSGLPRSGTSLMMQILEKGGVPVLIDEVRKADESNPRGYYEYEKVKRIREDNSWLAEAQGKALKVIAQLTPYLPPGYRYQVLFMERDPDEVLNSQSRMLERQNSRSGAYKERLRSTFAVQNREIKLQLKQKTNFDFITVKYTELIKSPHGAIERIAKFLNGKLDVHQAVNAVKPALYRERK